MHALQILFLHRWMMHQRPGLIIKTVVPDATEIIFSNDMDVLQKSMKKKIFSGTRVCC